VLIFLLWHAHECWCWRKEPGWTTLKTIEFKRVVTEGHTVPPLPQHSAGLEKCLKQVKVVTPASPGVQSIFLTALSMPAHNICTIPNSYRHFKYSWFFRVEFEYICNSDECPILKQAILQMVHKFCSYLQCSFSWNKNRNRKYISIVITVKNIIGSRVRESVAIWHF
jgi:hypothetical protein